MKRANIIKGRQMKKLLSLFIIIIMILSFAGCNSVENAISSEAGQPQTTSDSIIEVATEKPTVKPTEKPTEAPTEKPTVDIDWTEISYTHEDNDGYTFEVSMKFSPWILLSNTDTVNAAWGKVSNGNTLPGFDDWGLSSATTSNNYYQNYNLVGSGFMAEMTDMYYCIGEFKVKNITDGWRISSDNPRSSSVSLIWLPDSNSKTDYIWKVFYSNDIENYGIYGYAQLSMKQDNWGPVPFIIMVPELFSPKYPDGKYFEPMKNGKIAVGGEKLNLGIIGKDSIYSPTDE